MASLNQVAPLFFDNCLMIHKKAILLHRKQNSINDGVLFLLKKTNQT